MPQQGILLKQFEIIMTNETIESLERIENKIDSLNDRMDEIEKVLDKITGQLDCYYTILDSIDKP